MTASLGVQVFKSICFEIHVCCFYCHLLLFCHALKNKKMCTGNFGKKTKRVNCSSTFTIIRVMLKLSFYFWDYTLTGWRLHWVPCTLTFCVKELKSSKSSMFNVHPCPPAIMQKFDELANGMEQMQESEEKTSPQMALEKSSKSWNNRLLIALLIAQV